VSDLRTEEEQIDAIKSWWKDNGNALLLGIALALAAIFGWRAWQQSVIDEKESASAMFFELSQAVTAAESAAGAEEDAEQQAADISFLAERLVDAHSKHIYGDFARLYQARQLVTAGKYAEAEAVLQAVNVKGEDNRALASIVTIRLARVKAAQQKYDDAIKLLDGDVNDSFYVTFHELKGDILKMKGDRSSAKAAYEQALSRASELAQPTQLLQLKISDLADA